MSKRTIETFFNSNCTNLWVKSSVGLNCYLRKSTRIIDDKKGLCIDLANINNSARTQNINNKKKHIRTGKLIITMDEIEHFARKNNYTLLYIENVLNFFLPAWFVRNGFKRFITNTNDVCFYKELN